MGYGYWALVAMTITLPLTTTVGVWIAGAWVPGRPHSGVGIISMMRFGGTLTLNGLVVYVAFNMEKILLGRFWGVEAIGLYRRAYQLINTPTDSLDYSVGEVAFAALSRLQNDRPRFRNYFLKGYSLVLAMTIPITIMCAFFARGHSMARASSMGCLSCRRCLHSAASGSEYTSAHTRAAIPFSRSADGGSNAPSTSIRVVMGQRTAVARLDVCCSGAWSG